MGTRGGASHLEGGGQAAPRVQRKEMTPGTDPAPLRGATPGAVRLTSRKGRPRRACIARAASLSFRYGEMSVTIVMTRASLKSAATSAARRTWERATRLERVTSLERVTNLEGVTNLERVTNLEGVTTSRCARDELVVSSW